MASDPPKGWNDPPVVSYGVVASDSQSKKKPQLNKRVAFPSSGPPKSDSTVGGVQLFPQADSQNQSTGVPFLPPPPPSLPVTNSAAIVPNRNRIEESINEDLRGQDLQKDTLSVLTKCLEVCLKTLQRRTADDIVRRLGILTNMWNEGKLNEDVQIRLYKFSRALRDGNYDEANNIHMSLIVDHASQVTPWMVGVKHLIHESRKIGLHLANDRSSSEMPLETTTEG